MRRRTPRHHRDRPTARSAGQPQQSANQCPDTQAKTRRAPTPCPLCRRPALDRFAQSLSALCSTQASDRGGVQWSVALPDRFTIERQLSSVVRVRVETVLSADAPNGIQVRLLLVPFGRQAGGSLDSDEQLELATYFLDKSPTATRDPKGDPQVSASRIAELMTASARRSPGVLSVLPTSSSKAQADASGRLYVRYGYAASRCSGEIDVGECYGSVSRRRTAACVTVSSVSQYRTNTERERMAALGQARDVNVLWLLTASAPEEAWAEPAVAREMEGIVQSLVIP